MCDNMALVTTAQPPNYSETLENKGLQFLSRKQAKTANSKEFAYDYSKTLAIQLIKTLYFQGVSGVLQMNFYTK